MPLGTPAPDPALVEVFRSMRQDARSDPKPAELARPITIALEFDGGAALPTIGQCVVCPIGLINARIIAAAIVANGVGSATIDLRHGTFSDMPMLSPIFGATMPALSASSAVLLDVSTWTTINLQPFDVLVATLITVSSVASGAGALTSLTLSLYCRALKWPAGTTTLIDNAGNTMVTQSGNTLSLRS